VALAAVGAYWGGGESEGDEEEEGEEEGQGMHGKISDCFEN
jgi:hypothetical protein